MKIFNHKGHNGYEGTKTTRMKTFVSPAPLFVAGFVVKDQDCRDD